MPDQDEPVFPPDAMGATQSIHTVPDAMGPTQSIQAVPAAPRGASDRPLFRDEVPADSGADTAQFDLQDVNDYDDYQERGGTSARKGRIIMIAGFVALLVIAGGGAFFFASGGFSGGSSGGGGGGDTGGALAVESLFPETVDIEGQGTFTRVAVDDTPDCAEGTHREYGEALAENGCDQLVRASYLSEDENHAVTIGVASMASPDEAETALNAQSLDDAQWFAGLPGDEGTAAERLGYSGGYGNSGYWDRYLLFALAANSDGSEEGAAEAESASELSTIGDGFLDEAFTLLSDDRG